MNNKFIAITVAVTIMLLFSEQAPAIRHDGPYEGRVVDADTGKPLEGVVILGVWYRETPTPGGAVSNYHDSKETLSNKNGEFKIKGLGLIAFKNIIPMDVLIFKAGYEHIGFGPWNGLKKDLILRKKIKWEGKKAVIPLKKSNQVQKINADIPSRPNIPMDKMNLLTDEIDKERIAQGLKPFKVKK